MALSFICRDCKNEIIVKYLRKGETACCRFCGAKNIVPDDAAFTALEPYGSKLTVTADPAVPKAKADAVIFDPVMLAKGAWNPRGLAWLSFFFSILPSGIVYALNWGRLGRPNLKWTSLLLVLLAFLALMAAMLFIPNERISRLMAAAINGYFCFYYYKSQKMYYDAFIRQGGKKASFALPIANSLAFLLILILATIRVEHAKMEKVERDIETANQLIDNGELSRARGILNRHMANWNDMPLLNLSLSWLYYSEGHIDSALIYPYKLLSADSSNLEVKELITSMLTESSWIPEGRGKLTYWYKSGATQAVREYQDGLWDGLSTEWHIDGKMKSRISFWRGKEHGAVEFWYSNGNLMGKGTYVNGLREGLFVNYGESGALVSKEIYRNGELVFEGNVK